MSADWLEQLRQLPDADFRLGPGDAVPFDGGSVRAIETPGHTPGHVCLELADRQMFFSGDHVLPRITPNVSLELRGDPDPLSSYIGSLAHIEGNNHYEVLPAHEYRFRGLALRARELHEASAKRSLQVLEAASEQRDPTVYSVAREITWSRGFDSLHGLQFRLALSETAAHLQHLTGQGLVEGVDGLSVLES